MGLLSKVGKALNNITGASSAAKQTQQYALQSAEINNKYQKEFAQNAHQWEVQDLVKAGLNPILSAGGNGASASGGGVASATETSAGLSPIDVIGAGISAYNGIQTGKQIKAVTDNTDADTLYKKAQTQMQLLENAIKAKASKDIIDQIKADLEYTREQTKLLKAGKTGHIFGTGVGEKYNEITNKAMNGLFNLFGLGD